MHKNNKPVFDLLDYSNIFFESIHRIAQKSDTNLPDFYSARCRLVWVIIFPWKEALHKPVYVNFKYIKKI